MRLVTDISVHYSATVEGRNYTVADIDSWHKANGWWGIGYHFVIYIDGTVHKGRPIEKTPAAVQGHNTGMIAICFIGGLDKNKQSSFTLNKAQSVSLKKLIGDLIKQYPTIKEVGGHRDFSKDVNMDGEIQQHEWQSLCPGFNVKDWIVDEISTDIQSLINL